MKQKFFAALVKVIIFIVRPFFAMLYPVKFKGQDNIPETGAFMLCANHVSALDPVMMVLFLKRKIRFMAKKELFKNGIVAGVIREVGAFPIDRGHADLGAVREAIKVLTSGGGLGIFPQGTRSADNQRMQLHGGAALIVQRAGSPVIPVYIDGPYKLFRRIEIRIGRAIDLSEFGRKTDGATISQITDRIDGAIWAMK